MKYLLIGLLKVYRLVISPLYGDVCRYYPSCSAYALTAVQKYGAVRGSWLAARRLLRCHPWASGGYDPVPGTEKHYPDEDPDLTPGAGAAPDPAVPRHVDFSDQDLPGSRAPVDDVGDDYNQPAPLAQARGVS